ncbi:MAG TPA: hypothetical protein VG895_02785 [Patescibacteria group bacterium]|nr:hypothetical protein [Patescibacteria group bacterium]
MTTENNRKTNEHYKIASLLQKNRRLTIEEGVFFPNELNKFKQNNLKAITQQLIEDNRSEDENEH